MSHSAGGEGGEAKPAERRADEQLISNRSLAVAVLMRHEKSRNATFLVNLINTALERAGLGAAFGVTARSKQIFLISS